MAKKATSRGKRKTSVELGLVELPRPAFEPFSVEGYIRDIPLRKSLKGSYAETPPTVAISSDLHAFYMDAIGKPNQWTSVFDAKGELASKKRRKPLEPKNAAQALVGSALDAVALVQLLYKRQPELCRDVARAFAEWPISADMTETNWQIKVQQLVDDLKLGCAIDGFIRAAQSEERNPIRRYAAAIKFTLSQTRWRFKEGETKWRTQKDCPAWAAKTLILPRFIKANARKWAILGKEMLLEQRPNFLEDEALREQRFKWTRRAENRSGSGKPTTRAIQNEAFDDFAKELYKLAPAEAIYPGWW